MADVAHALPAMGNGQSTTQRWIAAGCFETIVRDLCTFVRWTEGRGDDSTAVIFEARPVQSAPERGADAGYDGYRRRKGRKTHLAIDTLGHLLAVHVTAANAQERDQVAVFAEAVLADTGSTVEVALWIRATPGTQQPPTRRRLASGWR